MISVGFAAESPKRIEGGGERADATAAIKRELEQIRAASDPRFQGPVGAPRVSVPEMRIDSVESPAPVLPPAASTRGTPPAKNTSNWLVDAMEQGAREQDERQQATLGLPRQGEREGLLSSGPEMRGPVSGQSSLLGDRRGSGSERERTSAPSTVNPQEKRPTIINPLTPYLGAWLTPHDYALLRPGLAADLAGRSAPGAGGPNTGIPSDSSSGVGAPTVTFETPGGYTAAASRSGTVLPRENPFLAGLTDTPRTPVPPAPSVLIPPASVSALSSAVERMSASRSSPDPIPVPPKIPDVAKPRPDETYFKQLKRF